MHESDLTPLSATALFSPADFCEVNQLADLLFNPEDHAVCLSSEHEIVTRAWVLSALEKSNLAKKTSHHPQVYHASFEPEQTPVSEDAWLYWDEGKLIRANANDAEVKVTTLCFPILSFDQRVKILHHVCVESLQTHVFSIPEQTIKTALEWQAHYCADELLLGETLLLLKRAMNRFLLTHTDNQQAALLEPQHVAEVLVDWQQANLNDLLNLTDDNIELKLFLSENIIGQEQAIEKFVRHITKNKFFILAGPSYSGKKTFIEYYAQFTHATKYFCIPFNLSYFSSNATWSSIFLPTPFYHKNHTHLSLLEIVQTYPHAIIMLTDAIENPLLLERLQREIKRGFLQIDDKCITIENITWMLTLDTISSEISPIVIQESIFTSHTSSELSDILYRPTINISTEIEENNPTDEAHALEEVKKQLPEIVFQSACTLIFTALTEKNKKQIINKEIKRIIHSLRSSHDISIYYQEEVIQFLLAQVNQGFEALHKNLYYQIETVFLKALEQGVITDGQVLMLQLNDTGRMLQIVRTAARSGATQAKLRI